MEGLKLGFEIYKRQTREESDLLERWAATRRFPVEALRTAEIFASLPPKIVHSSGASEREVFDALEVAGLLKRETIAKTQKAQTLPIELPAREFFSSPRIIFTIRDDRNLITGFTGRALEGDSPKYLFSPGFPRGSTLYRFHRVREDKQIDLGHSQESLRHVFVVEGFMDALRLEAMGLAAVGVLSSTVTTEQLQLLVDYAEELDRENVQLAVHLFLDADDAGRRGSVNAAAKLLQSCVSAPGLLVDVIFPTQLSSADRRSPHDPDELLLGMANRQEALELLGRWCHSPMSVFLAAALDTETADLASTWNRLPDSQKVRAFRDVERRLSRSDWIAVLDRVPAFGHQLGPIIEPAEWQAPLSTFLRATTQRAILPVVSQPRSALDAEARLIRALQIAEASTQRREFPVDEGSWDRLQTAVDVTLTHLIDLLSVANNPARLDAGPMLSVKVPKPSGKFRLKALPSPEVLTMQQYVLDELLRDYPSCPRFQRLIPGVRFSESLFGHRIETTGPEMFLPDNGTVSFAYMLDADVIEHRAAPQRTGMFRSYFDCWTDFIAHIDARVAAFPVGSYHVARLDIRSFYGTVPRSAINSVLLETLEDALAELADSTADPSGALECAPLFLPSITTPQDRAHALVDWLCDQSFGYEIEEAGTGEWIRGEAGLPQGPDLSAYLANISLFPLDRKISEAVTQLDEVAKNEYGQSSLGAVYARYVDDMVIIARTAHDLARLRAEIEKELALLGMELSPKTDSLPVMDQAEVREWLTDRRGAGLGVSGPFEGPPVNVPLALLEPLAHAGETDRSDSLLILYDPRLDDPELPTEELEDAIFAVRSTTGLRHGEQVAAARRLWRCVLTKLDDETPNAAAKTMAYLWDQSEPPWRVGDEPHQEHKSFLGLLAWLDGIDRFLGSRQDRNPTYSEEKHRLLVQERNRLAALVHAGLCERLIEERLTAGARKEFGHMLELKALATRRVAMLVNPLPSVDSPNLKAGRSPSKARLLISLAESQRSTALLDAADLRDGPQVSLTLLFHESCARLRLSNENQGRSADPLRPVAQTMMRFRQMGLTSKLAKVLDLWIPETSTSIGHECEEIALKSLINLAPKRVVDLLEDRSELKSFALDGSNDGALRHLPTPPGIAVPGLLGLRDADRIVLRADFRQTDAGQLSPSLAWIQEGSQGKWTRLQAPLDEFVYLPPVGDGPIPSKTPHWLAAAFRSLARQRSSEEGMSCPPNAANLLGPSVGTEEPESEWDTLGFCVSESRLRGQAFLQQGGGGLLLEPVLDQYDELWRVGTALADWLGRAHSSRNLSSQRLSAPSLISEPNDDWPTEGMLRFSLCRLRGRGLPARPLRISPETNLPLTIERVLRRLESFPVDTRAKNTNAGIAHLVATLAEGRAIQTRLRARFDPCVPGGGAALLATMTRVQFRSDEELAQRLPSIDALPEWAPMRRPARSLLALAGRLEALSTTDPLRDHDPTLTCLVNGTRILAAEASIRAAALELWSLIDQPIRDNFVQMPPSLADWGLDSAALLYQEQPEVPALQSKSERTNVRFLFQQLQRATVDAQPVKWNVLAGITPLGWLVVLGALTGGLAGDWRGSLADSVLIKAEGHNVFEPLVSVLAIANDGDDDLPWGGLSGSAEAWAVPGTRQVFEALNRIDVAAGLVVSTHQSSRFQIEASRRGPTEVQTSDGLRQLPGWAISWAKTINESRSGIEQAARSAGEDRAVFRWSETWRENRLIGIGVVQSAMAALAGTAFTDKGHLGIDLRVTPVRRSLPTLIIDSSQPSDKLDASKEAADSVPLKDRLEELATAASEREPARILSHSDQEIFNALGSLRVMQEDCWTSRSEKPESHARVALLQWEVDSSYLHPAYDFCDAAKTGFDASNPGMWTHSQLGPSCSEGRRRAILKSALQACHRFKVEILLLPEYSVRPETVEWLISELPILSPETSVWAGTYRLPPGMSKPSVCADWSAVHELVLPGNSSRMSRAKKYSSVAANEIFRPGPNTLLPLFAEQVIGDVRSYTFELICSEVFLVSCPANLRPLARARRELLRKFGARLGTKDLEATIRDEIVSDIMEFARLTGLSEGSTLRRTILLVPAMTRRTADYTVLGQAAFLSSGLTTVFCNAVHSYGSGESCFIGHNCWRQPSNDVGYPGLEPYHGVLPGIFCLNQGQLGKEEQALLIADIDPVYASEGRPRPQTLLKPLRLVAHLPIIEAWQVNPGSGSTRCRCGRTHHSFNSVRFAPELLTALQRGLHDGWTQTSADSDPNILFKALQKLFTEQSERGNAAWLRRRAKAYLQGHLADPAPWPPPVALDWLWVDPGKPNIDDMPRIEAPEFATPPL
jgi:hypothetical protein